MNWASLRTRGGSQGSAKEQGRELPAITGSTEERNLTGWAEHLPFLGIV